MEQPRGCSLSTFKKCWRYERYDSERFFSAAASTFIKSRGTALSTVTSWTIGASACRGAWRRVPACSAAPRARRLPPASPRALGPRAALICSVGVVLPNVVSVLASATGSVLGVRHRGGAGEVLLERLERRALERALGDRVLDDLVAGLRGAQLTPQLGDLRARSCPCSRPGWRCPIP